MHATASPSSTRSSLNRIAELDEDELAAVIAALREKLDNDKYPRARRVWRR